MQTPDGWISVDFAMPAIAWNGPRPLTWYLVTDGRDIYTALLNAPLWHEDPATFMRAADCTPVEKVTHWRFMPELPGQKKGPVLSGTVKTLLASGALSYVEGDFDRRHFAETYAAPPDFLECAPDIGDPCGVCAWCRANETPAATSISAADEVVEMRLCEPQHLVLKPDVLYRFTVDETCGECRRLRDLGVTRPVLTQASPSEECAGKPSKFWLRRIEELKAGDACEVYFAGGWHAAEVLINGGSSYWVLRVVGRRPGDDTINTYIEHVRCVGQTEAWPGREGK